MAGTEYFGQTAGQPRDLIPVNTMRKSYNHTLFTCVYMKWICHILIPRCERALRSRGEATLLCS